MIFETLYKYYKNNLEEKYPVGSEEQHIDVAIVIDMDGNFIRLDAKSKEEKFLVPTGKKRASDICPRILYDKACYVLGLGKDGDKRLSSFTDKIRTIASIYNDERYNAVLSFYEKNGIDKVMSDNLYTECVTSDSIYAGFWILGEDSFLCEDKNLYNYAIKNEISYCDEEAICTITGEKCLPVRITFSDIETASFVTFKNDRTYDSYGKGIEGFNAPISAEANHAYNIAFKTLHRDPKHHFSIGDTQYIFGTVSGKYDNEVANIFESIFKSNVEDELIEVRNSIFSGKQHFINDDDDIFIIGYKKVNNGRAAISYEFNGKLSQFISNVDKHFKYCDGKFGVYNIYVSSLKSSLKVNSEISSHSFLLNQLAMAIFEEKRYNENIAKDMVLRIFNPDSDKNGNKYSPFGLKIRTDYLRAILDRNFNINKETMNNSTPYLLGRYFASCVKIQSISIGKNYYETPIYDNYMRKMSSSPLKVISTVDSLTDYYLKKDSNKNGWVNKVRNQIKTSLSNVPNRFSNAESWEFILGFNDQWEAFFTKKDENSED